MKTLPLAAANFVAGPLRSICPPLLAYALFCDSISKEKERASYLTADTGYIPANQRRKIALQ